MLIEKHKRMRTWQLKQNLTKCTVIRLLQTVLNRALSEIIKKKYVQ